MHFKNKVKLLNPPGIFNHTSATSSIPKGLPYFKTHLSFIHWKKFIQSKVFSFNQFPSSLDLDAFIMNNSILTYNCANSSFKDKDYGNILTRSLRIIDKNKLKKRFTKGLKYRDNMSINIKKTRSDLVSKVLYRQLM